MRPENGSARHLTREEAFHTSLTTRCLLMGGDNGFSIWIALDGHWELMEGPDGAWAKAELISLWKALGAPVGQLKLVE